ncbi:MAG: tryptophan--tRNA ligase [Chloroflexi bacterium]|nr:tryptophan--tRNA ligase [Chloroflexota bacterium]
MKRVFSAARPTGNQHLGNYLGALKNYVALQEENSYQCLYCVADVHALTTMQNSIDLRRNTFNMVKDWIAAGLDPKRSIIFVQSHVPAVTELHTLLSMITPLNWLLRVPTFKEKVKAHPENVNYGLVGYPVLMTADVVLYKSEIIPVGEDQLPHLELAREIVRHFNYSYGPVFPEPQAKLTAVPVVIGLDGKVKMSKSMDNHVELSLSEEETTKRIMTAVTDVSRMRKSDPGHPDICNVFSLHKFFDLQNLEQIHYDCQKAFMGCVTCKQKLAQAINDELKPFRERRVMLSDEYIYDVIYDGAKRAIELANQTLTEAKEAIGLLR